MNDMTNMIQTIFHSLHWTKIGKEKKKLYDWEFDSVCFCKYIKKKKNFFKSVCTTKEVKSMHSA